jgi:hypothetical protein
MSAQIQALQRQIADLVEPNTRFDLTSLPLEASEIREYRVFAEQNYRVSFSSARRSGKGALPAGTLAVDGEGSLTAHVERQIATRRADLAERLRRWAAAQSATLGAKLTERDCHDGPSAAGFTIACRDCGGEGRRACGRCHGQRTVTCTQCHGTGRTSCRNCGGTAYQSCSACRGSGHTTQYKQVRRVNHADNREWTESVPEQQSCWQCGGQGKQRCNCSNGQVSCSLCSASGRITCNQCSGGGYIDCGSCAATGTLYETAAIGCTIEHSFKVRAPEAFDEAQAVLASLDSLESLRELTPIRSTDADAHPDGVTRRFEATMTIATAQLQAAGQTVAVHGYGERARVFDFKNLLGLLLESDVAELARQVAATPALLLNTPSELDASLSRVLLSEVNATIAQRGTRNAATAHELAAGELLGAVSADYVERAAKAIRAAVSRAYRASMLLPAAIAVVVPTLVIALLIPLIGRGNEALWFTLAAALVTGAAAELFGRLRFRKRFDEGTARHALAVLGATFEPWAWRLAMAAAMAVCVGAYLSVTAP